MIESIFDPPPKKKGVYVLKLFVVVATYSFIYLFADLCIFVLFMIYLCICATHFAISEVNSSLHEFVSL